MKTLFCSDLHLSKFDLKKFNYLLALFESYDRIVIVGDFWDSWFISFEEFLNSKWNGLFPLLKAKKCIYIFGNHDPGELVDSRFNQFAESASQCASIDIDGLKIHLSHGHQYKKPDTRFYVRLYERILNLAIKNRFTRYPFYWLLIKIEKMLSITNPDLIFKSEIAKAKNEIAKRDRFLDFKDGFYICGDTHYVEVDLENRFGNCGAIIHGFSSYILLEDSGFRFVRERY